MCCGRWIEFKAIQPIHKVNWCTCYANPGTGYQRMLLFCLIIRSTMSLNYSAVLKCPFLFIYYTDCVSLSPMIPYVNNCSLSGLRKHGLKCLVYLPVCILFKPCTNQCHFICQIKYFEGKPIVILIMSRVKKVYWSMPITCLQTFYKLGTFWHPFPSTDMWFLFSPEGSMEHVP